MDKIIELKDRTLKLSLEEDNELELSKLLKIDPFNLKEDISLFPFVCNQVNFLLVEANDILRKEEFKMDILKDNLEEYKARIFLPTKKELQDKGEKSPTLTLIDSQIILKSDYKDMKESIRFQKEVIADAVRNRDYLNSLYWSCKSKMELLISLSKNVNLNDF